MAACVERRPKPLGPPSAPPAQVAPIDLDRRPLSPSCVATPKVSVAKTLISLEEASPARFTQPVEVVLHDGLLYVVEQIGRVKRINENGPPTSMIEIAPAKIVTGGEAGLLGLAFHPQFAQNGFVYLYYTVPKEDGAVVGTVFESAIVRFHSSDGGLTLEPASEKRILTVDQPYSNHNGGTIAFGPDGFLYIGFGDGGSGGDPQNRAQDTAELLGKMLRIDVDGDDPYAIPEDNPYATGGGRPEIYALGLRNPYRFRFDPVTGVLWAGDVGQSAREEIDRIVRGGNYGWRVREGRTCYRADTCDATGLIDPVVDHPRSEATSITGGVVYRGTKVPLLTNRYVYGDFARGTLWAISIDDAAPTPMALHEGAPRISPSAFAIDAAGEIVVLDYGSGRLLRVTEGRAEVPEMPESLGATGCTDPDDVGKPALGLFAYDVNVPQWVDGATAQRYLSIPENALVGVSADGRLALPPGSVAMKTLWAEERRLETQLLLRRPNGTWDAYTYAWRDDQADADLVMNGATTVLPSGRTHVILASARCVTCHSAETPTIGLELSQLDRDDVDYGGGRTGNPLVTLEKVGILDAPVPKDGHSPLPRGHETAERRARGYLHANCAFCHRGGSSGSIDLRFSTPLRSTLTCDLQGNSPAGGRFRIAPGRPLESQVFRAMQTTGSGRMPPLGSLLPDEDALGFVGSWIESIAACD